MDDHPAITRLEEALISAFGDAPLSESVSGALAGAIKEFRRLELLAEGVREEGESIASLDKSGRLLAEFKSREERFRALVEHGADLIFITDAAGSITFVSDSIERILGYRWEDRPRRIVDLAHPGDADIVRQALTLAMALPRAPLPFEARLAARDGSYRVFAATAANFSAEPAIGGVIVNSHDITGIRKAEEALKEREELYHDIFENARDLIYTHDFNGDFLSVNKALLAASGYAADELLGKNISMLLAPDQLEKARGMIAAKLSGEAQNTHYELEVITKTGGRVLVELNTRIIMREGKPSGIHGIGRDITRRKETERELVSAKEAAEEATRVKDQFVAMVSHDLRAPLAAIRGMADLIRSKANAPDPAYAVSVAGRIVKSSDRLLGLLETLLNLNRLRSGGIILQPAFTQLRPLAEEHIERIAHLAERKEIIIRNELPDGTSVFADRELLGEVLNNLITNAIKFCRPGDHIVIFSPDGDPMRLAVRDTGPGVKTDLVPNLFRHDVKTSAPGSMGETGIGLGLPFCHDIVTA
ncbi:MAG: PAS domain S-box protein, partial [Nitrospinae bacterium]|nr:PAS domain S-box protein [Nitrospinota bacterium]